LADDRDLHCLAARMIRMGAQHSTKIAYKVAISFAENLIMNSKQRLLGATRNVAGAAG
jgi:hypothetical protein